MLHGVKVGLGSRRRSQLAANSLDAHTGHLLEKVGASTKEQLVVVAIAVSAGGQPAESIKIHLALEGSELGLAEVSVGLEESEC